MATMNQTRQAYAFSARAGAVATGMLPAATPNTRHPAVFLVIVLALWALSWMPVFAAASGALQLGPYARFVRQDAATIAWETAQDTPSILEYGETASLGNRIEDAAPKQVHSLTIDGLKPKALYFYVIKQVLNGLETKSEVFELETDYNFSVLSAPPAPSPYPADEWSERLASVAQGILDETGLTRGYCLDYGCGDGRLAYELARRSDLHIVGVAESADEVARARQALHAAGLYGARVTILQCPLNQLPFTKDCFNLVVSAEMLSRADVRGNAGELLRVMRPGGGRAFLGFPANVSGTLSNWSALDLWVRSGITNNAAAVEETPQRSIKILRSPLSGVGEWSHTFGDPAQTASSHDQRVVGRNMKLQWFGQPGPRGMVDRQSRNPSPLTVNGFLFVQGNNRVFGQDAYNGNINWALEIPHLRRVNVPRDSSNMCADDQSLYLAVGSQCWRLDAYSGDLVQSHAVAPPNQSRSYDWGYLACVGDRLFGSSVKAGSAYTSFDGPAFWYDSTGLESTAKVCSDNLFCLSKAAGEKLWVYQNGVIVNSSIAIGGGRVYFVESRNATAKSQTSGRISHSSLWLNQYLVALDSGTGQVLWEKAASFPASPYPMVFFLSYADEKIVIADSTSQYNLFAYSAQNGQLLWQKSHAWNRDNHGGHIYHPVIVNSMVIVEPLGYNLVTGQVVKSGLPSRGGCSTMSAAANTVHYVNWDYDKGSIYFWDLDTDLRRQMAGSRSSCWLSVISGSGLVLSPTASSGCTCRYPLQTSLGFAPR